ncbi:MAG: hypothetical protein ACJAVI_001405 [Candidatus Azotimanducaceae bacterium]|jgi:hypothetical protein
MQKPWRTNMHFYLKSTIVGLLLLTGCATAPIDSEVTLANTAKTYQSFSVSTANIPAFLGPIITSNFSVAMASKGLQPTSDSDNPDLNITLRYQQIDLGMGSEDTEGNDRVTMDDSLRFVARIVIEIREAGDSDIVWSGNVQRIHDVTPGEWMHTGNASVAFLDAFNMVLADF